jgi:hypothetical protein
MHELEAAIARCRAHLQVVAERRDSYRGLRVAAFLSLSPPGAVAPARGAGHAMTSLPLRAQPTSWLHHSLTLHSAAGLSRVEDAVHWPRFPCVHDLRPGSISSISWVSPSLPPSARLSLGRHGNNIRTPSRLHATR